MAWGFFARFRSKDITRVSFESLVALCRDEGEEAEAAQREILARFEPLVWRTVLSRVGRIPKEDQEEVVANTFIALFAQHAELLSRYDRALGLSPEGYIRRQAILQCSNRLRSLSTTKRRHEVELEPRGEDGMPRDVLPDGRPDPEASALGDAELKALLETFRTTLSPALSLTFELIYVRELDLDEVAAALGVSMDVVYTRKKRISETLERVMAERGRTHSSGVSGAAR